MSFQYKPQVNNNVMQQQTGLRTTHKRKEKGMYGDGMYGDGMFIDTIKSIFSKNSKEIMMGLADAYTSSVGTELRNAIPSSDDTARPGFAGEKHMILKLANGKNGVANYLGPDTEVLKRLKRGDPGRTRSDDAAKRHDIDYVLATGQTTKAKQLDAVRKADNRMIKSLKSIQESRGDASRNVQAGMRVIQAKTLGEDFGLLDRSRFVGNLEKLSKSDKAVLMSNRTKMKQKGYGLPGNALKMEILHGLDSGVKGFVMNDMIPELIDTLGIDPRSLPKSTIAPLFKKKQTSGDLAKALLPLLTHGKLRTMGKKMSGKGVMDLASNDKLLDLLTRGINKSIKSHLTQKGSGLNLAGGGKFFKDFKKGFTMVFKPFAQIAGPIITAMGVPEIGIPLGVVGGIL